MEVLDGVLHLCGTVEWPQLSPRSCVPAGSRFPRHSSVFEPGLAGREALGFCLPRRPS